MKKILKCFIVVVLFVIMYFVIDNVYKKPIEVSKSVSIDSSNKYIMVTDSKFMTLRNDGGSHIDIYYEIDFDKNKIIKYSSEYVGFEGYKSKDNIMYEEKLSDEKVIKLKRFIEVAIESKDEISKDKENRYTFYTLKTKDEDINIFDYYLIDAFLNIIEEK